MRKWIGSRHLGTRHQFKELLPKRKAPASIPLSLGFVAKDLSRVVKSAGVVGGKGDESFGSYSRHCFEELADKLLRACTALVKELRAPNVDGIYLLEPLQ